jgi:hypothetical protein
MKRRNYVAHIAVGLGLSLPSVLAIAQQPVAADADVPESAGVITPEREVAPKWKGFAPVPKAAKRAAGSTPRQEAGQRQGSESQLSEGRLLGSGQTFRSTSLLGTTISDAKGQPIGKVVDFVTDAQGNILYPLISYSGSPGFSGKLFAVPRGSLHFRPGADNSATARLAFDSQLLQNAPNFATSQISQLSDPAFQNRLNSYYQSSSFPRNAFSRTGGAMNLTGSSAVNTSLPLTGDLQAAQATGFNTANGTFVPNATVGGETVQAPAILGASGSPAGSTFTGGNVPSGASSIIGPSGAPGGSTLPGRSVIGPSGSPAGTSPAGGNTTGFASPQVNDQRNNSTTSSLFPFRHAGSPGSGQLFPQGQPGGVNPPATTGGAANGGSSSPGAGSGATPNTIGPSATPNTNGPSAVPNTNGPSATPNVGGSTSPAGK